MSISLLVLTTARACSMEAGRLACTTVILYSQIPGKKIREPLNLKPKIMHKIKQYIYMYLTTKKFSTKFLVCPFVV